VLEQQGLGGDGTDATGAKELRDGDQPVDGKDEDFTHRANRTMTASACKTVRRARIASHYEIRHPQVPASIFLVDYSCRVSVHLRTAHATDDGFSAGQSISHAANPRVVRGG
jgi:hypothetical protein